ncbi:hypothetical protein FDECE_10488 [Fusarium decemcellulare]|nr:hypothetical protein FDECE_10488 [Fusarium decemcellulare]
MSISKNPPKQNTGASIDAWHAVPNEFEDQDAWKARLQIDGSQHIRLVELNHCRYQHADIPKITEFLNDFGMHIVKETAQMIWWKGYGTHPYEASKLPGASQIKWLDDSPGGGNLVTIIDPDDFPVNLIYGQVQDKEVEANIPPELILNYETKKQRLGAYQRFTQGPAAVYRIGHFGICIENFARSFDFYIRTFNLVPSDIVYADGDSGRIDCAAFFHLDRGEEFTDHHTFFLGQSSRRRIHHTSFEVHDFDTQLLGHRWLEKKGYKTMWGVGRHLLGSQIFDYWWDTSGFMIEHYADGDVVNNTTKVGKASISDDAMSVWGPDRPIGWIK